MTDQREIEDTSPEPCPAREPETGAATSPEDRTLLQDSCLIDATRELDEVLGGRVLGQRAALDTLVCAYARALSGLKDDSRPLFTALLLGPTGVGKTETARAMAEAFFGSHRALSRIQCEEYAHSHNVSKLLGSPPGYVGQDVEPLLSQRRVDEHWHRRLQRLQEQRAAAAPDLETGEVPLVDGSRSGALPVVRSVVLFDEIEKAHPAVWNALLGILEEGTLTLGDNSTTDFRESVILLTSNVGSREMSRLLEQRQLGFAGQSDPETTAPWEEVESAALAAARRTFPLELLNRFDEVPVYRPLERRHLEAIFDKFLAEIHERTVQQAGVPLRIRVSRSARDLIVARGSDARFGARPLRRTTERMLVDPLSRFIAAEQVCPGDVVEVERDGDKLRFWRDSSEPDRVVA